MDFYDLTTISPENAEQARTAARALAPLASHASGEAPTTVIVRSQRDGQSVSVMVPAEAFQMFVSILTQMSMGNSITIVPHGTELTTQQAADFLNVSRPYFISLLDSGKIAHRKVGTHRRVEMTKLLEFKKAEEERHRNGLDELSAEAQKLKLDY